MLQLSNSDKYQDPESPMHAIFLPTKLEGELSNKFVVNASAGEEHSIVQAQIIRDGKPIHELVYGCGNNLRGQLGINRTSHLNDFTLITDISELYDSSDARRKPLHLDNLSCGKRHTLAGFEYGAFFFWGDNEFGQLGNRKRSFIESPWPFKKFEENHDVLNVVCGINSSAVICAHKPPKSKPKKKQKRVVTMDQISQSINQIHQEAEARMQAQARKESQEAKRTPITERLRAKLHERVYGDLPQKDGKDPGKEEVKKE